MKVVIARTAGFCKGVRDAIEITMNAIQHRVKGEDICTFGPLIHNRQVLTMLGKRGSWTKTGLSVARARR